MAFLPPPFAPRFDRMRRPQMREMGREETEAGFEFSGGDLEMPEKLKASEWRWGPEFRHEEFMDPYGWPDSGLYMRPHFMNRLLALRRMVGHPILIHMNGGFSSQGHAEGSAHYSGLAADFHVPDCPASRLARYIRSVDFSGVGFYEHWKPMAGFHLDMADRRARWVRTENGEYVSLT